nr:MAG TPA: hypothetical protein [Bacteriophage sp.]
MNISSTFKYISGKGVLFISLVKTFLAFSIAAIRLNAAIFFMLVFIAFSPRFCFTLHAPL